MACIPSRGKRKVYVTGVLILHRINDAPLSQTAHRVNSMLKCLCGNTAMNSVMIGTTMWDVVSEDEGNERFDKLCETGAWKEMITNGAGNATISSKRSNAKEEAEKIVTQLIKNVKPVELAIQDEMVNQKLTVEKTSAGKIFDAQLRGVEPEAERESKELRDRPRDEGEATMITTQDEIRIREEEVARLTAQAKEQACERQAQVEHLRLERKKAKREMKEQREMMRKENEADTAKIEEEIRSREKEVALLKQQVGAMDSEEQLDHAERLKREQEKAEREIERLQERMREGKKAAREKIKTEMKAREVDAREKKRQANEQIEIKKAAAKLLQQEIKTAVRAIREMKDAARRDAAAQAQAAKLREETSAQLREPNEVKPQAGPGFFRRLTFF